MDLNAKYTEAPGWDQPAAGRCRARTRLLFDFLLAWFDDSDDLGCYGNRAKTAGTSPSVHRDGRAFDIGFLTNEVQRQECVQFLVHHMAELGVQMVLNYTRADSPDSGTFTRLARRTGEQGITHGTWSKYGHWLHVEIHDSEADDDTPIEQLLGLVEPLPPAVPNPPTTKVLTVEANPHQIRRGDTGGWVKKVQRILPDYGQDPGAADGQFGPRTDTAVRNVQRYFGLADDGIVGPKTWGVLYNTAPD